MADEPKVVRGHPDEQPQDMPIIKPPDDWKAERSPQDRQLQAKALQSARLDLAKAKQREENQEQRKSIHVRKSDCFSIPTSPALNTLFSAMQNVDSYFIFSYVLSLLCDPVFTSEAKAGKCWIDLNDVVKRIGFDPRSARHAEEARRKVYAVLNFVARRNSEDGPLWTIDNTWSNEIDLPANNAPLCVHLTMSQGWQKQIRDLKITHFVPGGEIVSRIPSGRTSNVCARVVGLNLLIAWGRKTKCKQTRKDFLRGFPPASGSPIKLLDGKNPDRATICWRQALEFLSRRQVIALRGEATPDKDYTQGLPRKNWGRKWLSVVPEFYPGEAITAVSRNLAEK